MPALAQVGVKENLDQDLKVEGAFGDEDEDSQKDKLLNELGEEYGSGRSSNNLDTRVSPSLDEEHYKKLIVEQFGGEAQAWNLSASTEKNIGRIDSSGEIWYKDESGTERPSSEGGTLTDFAERLENLQKQNFNITEFRNESEKKHQVLVEVRQGDELHTFHFWRSLEEAQPFPFQSIEEVSQSIDWSDGDWEKVEESKNEYTLKKSDKGILSQVGTAEAQTGKIDVGAIDKDVLENLHAQGYSIVKTGNVRRVYFAGEDGKVSFEVHHLIHKDIIDTDDDDEEYLREAMDSDDDEDLKGPVIILPKPRVAKTAGKQPNIATNKAEAGAGTAAQGEEGKAGSIFDAIVGPIANSPENQILQKETIGFQWEAEAISLVDAVDDYDESDDVAPAQIIRPIVFKRAPVLPIAPGNPLPEFRTVPVGIEISPDTSATTTGEPVKGEVKQPIARLPGSAEAKTPRPVEAQAITITETRTEIGADGVNSTDGDAEPLMLVEGAIGNNDSKSGQVSKQEAAYVALAKLPNEAKAVIDRSGDEASTIDGIHKFVEIGVKDELEGITIAEAAAETVLSGQEDGQEAGIVVAEFTAPAAESLESASVGTTNIEEQDQAQAIETAPAITIDQAPALSFEIADVAAAGTEQNAAIIDEAAETGIAVLETQNFIVSTKNQSRYDHKPAKIALPKKAVIQKSSGNIKQEVASPAAEIQEKVTGIEILDQTKKIIETVRTPVHTEIQNKAATRNNETKVFDASPIRQQREPAPVRLPSQRSEREIPIIRSAKETIKPVVSSIRTIRDVPRERVQPSTISRAEKVVPIISTISQPRPRAAAVTGRKRAVRPISQARELASQIEALSKLVRSASPTRPSSRTAETPNRVITFKPASAMQDKEETSNNNLPAYERELALVA